MCIFLWVLKKFRLNNWAWPMKREIFWPQNNLWFMWLKQCFLWNITLHAALTGRAKNEHQIWFMHMYKGSNLPLLGCYYFLVYVTRSERLGKGCPTLHTVHNRYRTVFSKRSQRIWNLLNISITKPTFFIGNWKKNQVFQNFIKQQKFH